MYLITVFVAAYVFPTIAMILQTIVVRRFLARTPSISNDADLEAFKKVARLGMYLAAAALPFLAAGFVTCILVTLRYGLRGLLLVLVVNGIFFAVGKLGKGVEERARSLESSSPQLAEEHGRVSATWMKKLFPDF
ncbi:MAG: hypothetical protein JXB04_08260 [Kiritimatiellae bacterium]|nr:hypothetical protein [Kiritimatiellia bacterium]